MVMVLDLTEWYLHAKAIMSITLATYSIKVTFQCTDRKVENPIVRMGRSRHMCFGHIHDWDSSPTNAR